MRPFEAILREQIIGHPACESCGAPMWLTCIEPDRPDHDKRTFECPRCQHVMIRVVSYKPTV